MFDVPLSWEALLKQLEEPTQAKILESLGLVLVAWALNLVAQKLVARQAEDTHTRYHWKKTATYVIGFCALVVIARLWFEGMQSLATFLGLVSAGIAVAMRDPLVNLAGWLFILWRKPFVVSDRIQVGPHKGDVIDLRLFNFTLLEVGEWVQADQSTGRVIHLPNSRVFTDGIANYQKGFQLLWNEIPVMVTFESNWRKALQILQTIGTAHSQHLGDKAESNLRKASQKMMIFYATLTSTVYLKVADSGVVLTIRYLCEPRQRRGSEHAIWMDILDKFAEADDIDFAYPTQRMYAHWQEGKAPWQKPFEHKPLPVDSITKD